MPTRTEYRTSTRKHANDARHAATNIAWNAKEERDDMAHYEGSDRRARWTACNARVELTYALERVAYAIDAALDPHSPAAIEHATDAIGDLERAIATLQRAHAEATR